VKAPSTPPLTGLPVSFSLPITLLANEIGSSLLPGQNALTGTNTTTQKSPLLNADVPINACSLSIGLFANAASSCSTTSVGLAQLGAIGTINIPITAEYNAIGLLGAAAKSLGLTTGQSPGSTTQDGAINVYAPISLCAINVGLVADTASDCNLAGTNGTVNQTGVIDAAVPVTVCDIIVEIDGDSASKCPQHPDTVTQKGQLADAYAPITACGVVAVVDGKGTGMCMPVAGLPLVNGLPTNDVSQSAPIDGVLPINACSIVVAVDATASNQCEPTHLKTNPTGSVPVNAPFTVCAVTAALAGNESGSCTGAGSPVGPIGTPGSPGTGVTIPVTVCGIEVALGGTSAASCPQPTVSTSPPTSPSPSTTTPPVHTAAAVAPAAVHTAASSGPLALTGAPLLVELLIGAAAVILGLAISRRSRRRGGASVLTATRVHR
jgi:hypothetical protein